MITDLKKIAPLAKKSIARHVHCVEHRWEHALATASKKNMLAWIAFPRQRGALLSHDGKGVWSLFPNGIFCEKSKRATLLERTLSQVLLKKDAKKVVLELDEELRKEFLERLKKSKTLKALSPNYILHWPVFDMDLFDQTLSGKRWKKMRNIKNRFTKQHAIKIVDSKKVPKESLRKIMKEWLTKRKHSDTVDPAYYHAMIDNGFKGCTYALTVYVDSEPCTITAGWRVQNGKKHYYSAIGILNYRHKGLGEFANLMDLLLKKKGYALVDFGGSDRSLLAFKNKFRPQRVYKTYSFSVVRK